MQADKAVIQKDDWCKGCYQKRGIWKNGLCGYCTENGVNITDAEKAIRMAHADICYELPTGFKMGHQFCATVTRNGGSIKVGCNDLSCMPRLMSDAWEAMEPRSIPRDFPQTSA